MRLVTKTGVRCAMLAAFAATGLVPSASAAGKPKVSLEFKVTVTVGQKNLNPAAQRFVADLQRELETSVRSRSVSAPQIAILAEQRAQAFESEPPHRYALRGSGASGPAKAEVEVSFSITIKTGGKHLSPQDRAFLRRLERELAADVEAGRLEKDAVPAAVQRAMDDYAARQPGRTPSWGDRPDVTVMIGFTVKF
jgi:hypothetical protein